VKRIFPIIVVLIALSLIGIILIQVSWLKNMVKLREEQVKHKVHEITTLVSTDLAQFKTIPVTPDRPFLVEEANPFGFQRPFNVYQRFTSKELHLRIYSAFLAQQMEEIPFEFGLAVIYKDLPEYKRKSAGFDNWNNPFEEMTADTANYQRWIALIEPQSGSEGENLATEEALVIIVPNIHSLVLKGLRPRIVMAIIFTIIIFTAFFLTVRTMLRQKKLSEIKNDFINNMTHEFKTPIATISLAVDALRNIKVQQDTKKMTYFSDIIKEENQRMNRQVETILKAALLERQDVQLNLKPLHLHEIIQDVSDNFMLRLQEKQGSIELHLDAENDLIDGDEVHISNLVNNLMDNAVKYSKETVPPRIVLNTSSTDKRFILTMEDNGIGMNRETVKRIFEKFYRAHTGNIHNVKGFGLGLTYVKTVVEGHDGNIKAESTLGKGSCFTIDLPLAKK
jgi:two-component system, OmpR family, phosphate regulon sensor histidine kinase PhoR